jgi:hypothetical protein
MQPIHGADDLIRKDFLRLLQTAGFPRVDSADLSAVTLTGILGPGQPFWESFARLAPLGQLRHIRQMLQWQPSVFSVEEPSQPARR